MEKSHGPFEQKNSFFPSRLVSVEFSLPESQHRSVQPTKSIIIHQVARVNQEQTSMSQR